MNNSNSLRLEGTGSLKDDVTGLPTLLANERRENEDWYQVWNHLVAMRTQMTQLRTAVDVLDSQISTVMCKVDFVLRDKKEERPDVSIIDSTGWIIADISCSVAFAVYFFLRRHVQTNIYFQVIHTHAVQTFDFYDLLVCTLCILLQVSTSKK